MKYETASFEMAAGQVNQLPPSTLPEIVFSGRSNVGKSSLINKVLNRKALARVSARPGKTGTINFYSLPGCRLVDLPGYGYAKVSQSEKLRWAKLVEGYFAAGRNIPCVVQIVDFRHEPTQDDKQMIDFLRASGFGFVVAATKSDKLNKTQREVRYQSLREYLEPLGVSFILFSTVTGEGVEEIKRIIEGCAEET